MSEINVEARDRYYAEVSLKLSKAGFTPQPQEDGYLPIDWNGSRLCRLTTKDGVLYKDENVKRSGGREALDRLIDIARTTDEYMQCIESAKNRQAETVGGGYTVLSEYNGTVSEFKDAFSTLHSTSGSGRLRIESVDCPVSNLGKYIVDEDISDPDVREKLNTLAEKVNAMNALEAKTCAGALDATSINSLDDVVRVVRSLNEYIFLQTTRSFRATRRNMVVALCGSFAAIRRSWIRLTVSSTGRSSAAT